MDKKSKRGLCNVIGGGFFIPNANNNSVDYTVLAQYVDPPHEGKIAVVLCRQGKGKSVLSGPHWEFDQDRLNNQNDEMRQKLEESTAFRKNCTKKMLKKLLT